MWVRWVALVLFVGILGTVFVSLGEWQLHRLSARRAGNAVITTNEAAPVVDVAEIFGRGPVLASEQWRRVRATGTFDADHQYVIRYARNDAGDKSGYEVLTPLHTASGLTVLVNRGFVALDGGVKIPDVAPAPPSGEVTVVGHTRIDQVGRRGSITPVNNQVRLINSSAIAATLPYPITSGYVGALTMTPAQAGGFVPVETPEISDGPHFWYAVQWFMFTGIGIAGIVVFIRGDLAERRQRRVEDAAAEQDRHAHVLAGSDHGSQTD